MEVVLDTGVDMIVKRGWYENAPFYSPPLFRKFMVPSLQEEAMMAHQAGAKLAYQTTTGLFPFLDVIIECGADLIQGVDPGPSGDNDMEALGRGAAGRIALQGGVGYLEVYGTLAEVRQAVADAIGACGPYGGFILSAVGGGGVYPPDEREQEILDRKRNALIEAWRELRHV